MRARSPILSLSAAVAMLGPMLVGPHPAQRSPAITPPLHVSGTRLSDSKGRTVRPTGLNDPVLVPTDAYDGPSSAPRDLAAWGFRFVRLLATWQNWELTTPASDGQGGLVHSWNTAYESAVRAKIAQYASHRVLVILSPLQQHNWTDLPWDGGPVTDPAEGFPHWVFPDYGTVTEAEARCDYWSNTPPPELPTDYWTLTADFEAHVAAFVSDLPNVVGIEPFNEPFSIGWCEGMDLDGFYQRVVGAVHAANATVVPFVSDTLQPGAEKSIHVWPPAGVLSVYCFHEYNPSWSVGEPKVTAYLSRAQTLGAPAWLGEFIGYHYMETGSAIAIIDTTSLLNRVGAARAGWSYYAHDGMPGGLTKQGSLITVPDAATQLLNLHEHR